MSISADILSYNAEELTSMMVGLREPAYKSKQLFTWLHKRRVVDFGEMTNLSMELRQRLSDCFAIKRAVPISIQTSADKTKKFLYALDDGNCVETVAMTYNHGISVCVSSQVGCRMGCAFCASTQNGIVRNLTPSEILTQVYETERQIGQRIDSVVLMGIGEPLDNFENVMRFCELITDSDGYDMSNRSISLSTCGIVPMIDELAKRRFQLTLSVSLHAATDEKRSQIMPVNKVYPLPQLMAACRRYTQATKRRISFEYAVIHGTNDNDVDARDIAKLVRGMISHINLIPVNPAVRGDFCATRENAQKFCEKLTKLGLNATVRRTLGADISAACGQLRRDTIEKNS
ncbi:MAG: 23S rRNA (adenine(2503)-C(2))-methyltransferase RlmN [Oscillospiraceae bacterium]